MLRQVLTRVEHTVGKTASASTPLLSAALPSRSSSTRPGQPLDLVSRQCWFGLRPDPLFSWMVFYICQLSLQTRYNKGDAGIPVPGTLLAVEEERLGQIPADILTVRHALYVPSFPLQPSSLPSPPCRNALLVLCQSPPLPLMPPDVSLARRWPPSVPSGVPK
jgi:hypothetical protein